jgi:LacI family transcriptional regulator
VDGMAIHGGTVSIDTIATVAEQIPVVVMASEAGPAQASVSVANDTMEELTRHLLIDHGYHRLAFVGTPDGSPDVTTRWQAFLAAHEAARRTPPSEPIRVGLQQSDGALAAEHLLDKGGERPDAVVCANDETALGFLLSALGRGLRVPQDIAITGFDDLPMAALVRPALTTIRQPIRELAATTARLLADPLGEPAGDLVLPTELVLRGSCGCGGSP